MSELSKLLTEDEKNEFKDLHETITYEEYLSRVKKNPNLVRNAYQRVADMIESYGVEKTQEKGQDEKVHYNFFDDPIDKKDAIFGIDDHLNKLVNVYKMGANGFGAEKRILLLHGPVGSSKSSIARLLKKGLERYSKTEEGKMFTYEWHDEEKSDILGGETSFRSPMNEDPLKLLPLDKRQNFLKDLKKDFKYKKLDVKGELNPACRFILNKYLEKYDGDLETVLKKHIRVKRLVLSEKDRVGIGTFQPKDEKNQDSTELTGDINYRKIAEYGSDSDPRAFNFDGEFNVANRGIVEFVEMLKLDTAFLYDLLGASQEQCVKPKKFAQTDIDEVILGHTNEPEYRKLQGNQFMEALRDRTIKIDVPYITKLDDEVKIYQKDFTEEKCGLHIAPHCVEIASTFSVLSRLEEPKTGELDVLAKMNLYNGKKLPGYNEDSIRELKQNVEREGFIGVSPRYIQDKLSNTIMKGESQGYVSPFMVLNELKEGLSSNALIVHDEDRERCEMALNIASEELNRRLKNDVMKAIALDESAITTLCSKYIDHIKAYTQKEKVRNQYSNKLEEVDEKYLRSVEEKIDIPESRKDDFRREMMNYIGALAIEGKQFNYKTNDRLYKALEMKLYETQKTKLSSPQ
jgi:serine protein kinase